MMGFDVCDASVDRSRKPIFEGLLFPFRIFFTSNDFSFVKQEQTSVSI
tara:strand:- start:118 stop:261 length:144 start_codon:yes stop_codon:yes gene_type:complete